MTDNNQKPCTECGGKGYTRISNAFTDHFEKCPACKIREAKEQPQSKETGEVTEEKIREILLQWTNRANIQQVLNGAPKQIYSQIIQPLQQEIADVRDFWRRFNEQEQAKIASLESEIGRLNSTRMLEGEAFGELDKQHEELRKEREQERDQRLDLQNICSYQEQQITSLKAEIERLKPVTEPAQPEEGKVYHGTYGHGEYYHGETTAQPEQPKVVEEMNQEPSQESTEAEIREFLHELNYDPYPEDIFPPLDSAQLTMIQGVLVNNLGIPIDRLSAHIGRLLRKPLREKARAIYEKFKGMREEKGTT